MKCTGESWWLLMTHYWNIIIIIQKLLEIINSTWVWTTCGLPSYFLLENEVDEPHNVKLITYDIMKTDRNMYEYMRHKVVNNNKL